MFDPAYFDPLSFETLVLGRPAGPDSSGCDPYFDCSYFDQTYFCTDCGQPAATGAHHAVRLRPVIVPDDEADELLAIL